MNYIQIIICLIVFHMPKAFFAMGEYHQYCNLAQSQDFEIHKATRAADPSRIQALLTGSQIEKVNTVNAYGETALHIAASMGNLDLVTVLTNNKALIDVQDNGGCTPLYNAAKMGYVEIVTFLVYKKKAKVNTVNAYGETPLHIAASIGKLDLVTVLTNNKALIDVRDKGGCTPLYNAAEMGYVEIVTFLVYKKKAKVNLPSVRGITALMIAASNGHDTIASKLTEAGADINRISLSGSTALSIAVAQGHHAIVQSLLTKGALQNKDSQDPHIQRIFKLAESNACVYKEVPGLSEKFAKTYHLLKTFQETATATNSGEA